MTYNRLCIRGIACAFVLLCTACGGGGGGSGTTPAPAPTPVPDGAVNDTLNVNEDSTAQLDVTANDTNVDAATANLIAQPAEGVAEITNGILTYTPAPNFNGSDSVTYEVTADNGSTLFTASVAINVNSVNDAPIAMNDSIVISPMDSTSIAVLDNDSDPDHSNATLSVAVTNAADNGSTAVLGNQSLSYQPVLGFAGCDRITYSVTDPDGASASATAAIDVFTPTSLQTAVLNIPTGGYSTIALTPTEDILASTFQTFTLPSNSVSFVLSLVGPDVEGTNALFLVDVEDPSGARFDRRDTIFCELGLCTIQVPKTVDIRATPGAWRFRVGTRAADISDVDTTAFALTLATRTGVDETCSTNMELNINPFKTGSLSTNHVNQMLAFFAAIATDNNIDTVINPLTEVSGPEFAEVPDDFTDVETATLVRMGNATEVNLFFIESFSVPGGNGLLGVSGGLPGPLGVASEYNGVLINGTANQVANLETYYRATAEVAFHEMGHLLGLFHTSEADGSEHDLQADTPQCLPAMDSDNNGQTNADECPDGLNPMFWENNPFQPKSTLSADQLTILKRSPITRFSEP